MKYLLTEKQYQHFKHLKLNESENENSTLLDKDVPEMVYKKEVTTQVDPYLQEVKTIESLPPVKKTLDKSARGPELINQEAVNMKDEELDAKLKEKSVDSLRLEKAWRMISSDLTEALKTAKVEFEGKTLADNIKMKGETVTFDFTFQDKDSTAVKDENDGKVPFKKNMLAGKIITSASEQIKTTTEYRILLEVDGGNKKITLEPQNGDTLEVISKKYKNLTNAGYAKQAGTYDWLRKGSAMWVKVEKEAFDKVFKDYPKTYFKGEPADKESWKIFKDQLEGKYIQKAK